MIYVWSTNDAWSPCSQISKPCSTRDEWLGLFREYILVWTSQVVSDARIDQLEGRSPESCLSWLRSNEGCPKHDLFLLEHSRFVTMLRLYCKF